MHMILQKEDKTNNFISLFNPTTGFYLRTGIIREGQDTGEDPFMCSFPELIDVGIMGHCKHGKSGLCAEAGIECYQEGKSKHEDNMSLRNFRKIVDECKGKTFQIALGGRGDPDQHEHFEEILAYCKSNGIVPNLTTSGLGLNEKSASLCNQYCGAVAVSWYRSDYTLKAIQLLIDHKVKTNIHYVLARNSIDEAIALLKNRAFPSNINAVIFLLHKPVGAGTEEQMLTVDDERLPEFFSLAEKSYDFKIGFDSCTVPALLQFCQNIDRDSIDSCEGARWSMYIHSDMVAMPCSFDNARRRWAVDLKSNTIQNAWYSKEFKNFRDYFRNSCPECTVKNYCYGGCPVCKEIVLCKSKGL